MIGRSGERGSGMMMMMMMMDIYIYKCNIHNNTVVLILSYVLQKVQRSFGLSTSDPFTLVTSSGLIGPRHTYNERATPTAVLNFEKKKKTNYLMATASHSNQSEIDVDISGHDFVIKSKSST